MTKPGQVREAAGLVLVLGVAAWARLAVYPKVLLDRLSPANGDSEYHLRRMLLAWEHFPRSSVFDPLLGWPAGAAHPWAPGYDWVAAALLRLTGLQSPESLAFAAALFPVLVGLGTVAAVVSLARLVLPEDAPPGAALGAGLLAGLVPQFVGASRLARTDHHVWEAASLVLLTCWALAGLEAPRRPGRFEAAGVVITVATLAGFSGGPLYVALVVPLLVARLLLDAPSSPWGTGAGALAGGAALSALINLGPIGEHGRWLSFGYPSLLQPALTLAAAAAVLLAWSLGRWQPTLPRRVGLFLGLGAGLGLVALALPGLGPQVRGGLGEWLFKKDPWLSSISEFQPLFGLGRPPLESVLFYLGLTGLAATPLLGVAWLGERRRALVGVTFVFLSLGALTLLQMRFGRVWAPLLGVAAVLGLVALGRRWPRAEALVVAAGVLVLAAADPEVRRELELADPRAKTPIEELSDGLRLERPARAGRREGVLARWEYGHTLISRAGRPVIASGFGSYVDREGFVASEQVFAGGEEALLTLMDQRDLGLVVTGLADLIKDRGPTPLFRPSSRGLELNPAALGARPLAVLAQGGSGLPGVAPHVAHLMPIAAVEPRAGSALPPLWAFERVAGTKVTRPCVPGRPLIARLSALVGEQPFEWVAWAPCAPEGEATVTLCVPTGVVGAGFATSQAWRVETADGVETLSVPLSLIRSGAPNFVTPR